MNTAPMFKKGTYIVYVNGDRYEIGRVVSIHTDGAFVCYHEGETAAKTPYECMHRLENQYVMTSLGGDRFADSNISGRVEFVSYTGKFPNLCSGILTLNIDGEEVRFGHDYLNGNYNNDGNYDSFWASGGGYGLTNGWSDSYVDSGKWKIYKDNLPKKYQQYAKEIEEVFNDNVPYGCCGGCL